jgi:hypothetical protein
MILPTKHLSEKKSLLLVGANILVLLEEPKTVSRIWNELRNTNNGYQDVGGITYSWFVLAIDLLYCLGAIHYDSGRLSKASQ